MGREGEGRGEREERGRGDADIIFTWALTLDAYVWVGYNE